MNALTPFVFENNSIRVIDQNGDPWFVLRDLLDSMGSSTPTAVAVESIKKGLGDGLVKTIPLQTAGGEQQTIIVAEPAATYLIARSNTARSRNLNRFIHVEVLPSAKKSAEIIRALNDFEVPDDLPDMYVYAIRERETGNVKLGISRDPQQRLRQLQTGNSSTLELVAYRKAENRFADERAIHADADAYRLRGEWFDSRALEVM